jgi:hypothetical protein
LDFANVSVLCFIISSTIKRQLNWNHLAKNSDDASYRNIYQATVLSGEILSFCFHQMSKDFGGPINEDSAIGKTLSKGWNPVLYTSLTDIWNAISYRSRFLAIVSDAVDWVLSLVKGTLDRQLVTA